MSKLGRVGDLQWVAAGAARLFSREWIPSRRVSRMLVLLLLLLRLLLLILLLRLLLLLVLLLLPAVALPRRNIRLSPALATHRRDACVPPVVRRNLRALTHIR